jgi:hypothetical protein
LPASFLQLPSWRGHCRCVCEKALSFSAMMVSHLVCAHFSGHHQNSKSM